MNIFNTNKYCRLLCLQKLICCIVILFTLGSGSLVAQTYTVISVSGSNNITLSRNDCSTVTTTGHCIQSADTTPYVGLSYSWNGSFFVSSISSYQDLGGSSPSCGTQCENNTSGGSISGNQTLCGGNSVSTISNSSGPSGGSGTQSYRWQYSTNNSSWNTISGATGSSYNPGSISSTRYYRRQAQRSNCTSWISSNSVTKTVTTNVTSGGTISGNQSMCGSYNPSNMANVSSPSGGGSGNISYRWQQSSNGSSWLNISHFSSSYQPGGPLTSTKYYRRGALRSGCSSAGYVYSNVIVKEVSSQPVGTPCNDNNSNTNNDVIQSDGCTCSGSSDPCATQGGDSDNDGICNSQDCSPFNPSLPASPGTSCNDNNANTINDVIQSNGCSCAGTFDSCAAQGGDSDNDGVCNDEDCAPFDPNFPKPVGTVCNDNNANTVNDVIQTDGCTCAGTFDSCAAQGGDSDNDGVCNDEDCAPFDPNFPKPAGTTCNDNNASTVNDVIQTDGCTCAGTFDSCAAQGGDSDNDGVCNDEDCAPFDPNFPKPAGTTCNDNNASTVNDVIQTDGCTCAGTFDSCAAQGGDSDNDGVCNDEDCAPFDPNFPKPAGTACNDGNVNTINDVIQADGCNCLGELDDCARLGGDSDNDGVCDSQDCEPFNPNIPAAVGSSCNDENANTSNDIIQADGCTCAGTPDTGNPDCNDISITTGNGTILIGGLNNAPITAVQVYTSSWTSTYSCFANCNAPSETITAAAGDYIVYVSYYDANYNLICQENVNVTVITDGGCTDADNDGVCVNVDCDDNNPNLPAAVGSSCNDGNTNTDNDIIQADGCTCEGTPNGGGGTPDCNDINVNSSNGNIIVSGLDGAPITSVQVFTSAWAGVYSCFADCDAPTETIAVPAGDYLVFVKYYDANYSLVCQEEVTITVGGGGGCTDADNDGVCENVDCDDNNPNLPAVVGSSCNDGNANTTNDVIQADGCTCAGTPGGGGGTPDCNDINVNSSNGNIIVSGLDGAPITSVQVFTSAWAGVYNCFADCNAPTETIAAPAGDYIVFVKYYDANYNLVCQEEVTITVGGGGGCTDADNDGVCANVDCDDNNPNLPAAVGSSCNDGNGNTNNDIIQADGCSCAGTPNGGGSDVDLALTVTGNGNNVGAYQTFTTTFTVVNEGTQTSNNIVVNIPQPTGVVFQGGNPFTASTGDYNYYSTFDWSVGTLTPGQSETIILNYFTIADGPYTVYGQITDATGTDVDSTPNNGTPSTPNEDDEAVYQTNGGNGGGNPLCTLTLQAEVNQINCNNNGTPNNSNDDTFSFTVTVTGGNPWGWSSSSQNGGYDVPVVFGPYPISGGNLSFTIEDMDNPHCTVNVNVEAPNTCSSSTTTPTGCDDIFVSSNSNSITISGLDNSPLSAAWIFNSNWETEFNCSYECSNTETTSLSPGTYYYVVKKMTTNWEVTCVVEGTITVGNFNDNGTTNFISNNSDILAEMSEKAALRTKKPQNVDISLDISISPNPAQSFVKLELDNPANLQVEVSVFNQLGKVVEYIESSSNNEYVLDIQDYPAGCYFIIMKGKNGEYVSKQLIVLP